MRTESDKELLEVNYAKYKVSSRTPQELLKKMVLPPTSLIIAQASVESGWGSSKLAQLTNNLFGMTSLSKSDENSVKMGNMRYKKYAGIYESIEDYILTISRHNAIRVYEGEFEEERIP
ncbi:Exo-glucosaminidase lytG precursor [Fusobacterium necrophorum subsp. necrophorum]|nr:Exo-glucosaminidase lytG precursor [Fusobacterium necrophorum subsp. necrophorum]